MHFNNSGLARTYDHLMPAPTASPAKCRKRKASGREKGAAVAEIIRGKGRYKSSTPEYISRMAFGAANTPLRALTADGGGGAAHAGHCGSFLASCIESHEQAEARRRNGESRRGEPFDFYITNNMYDETRLTLSGFGRAAKRQRVLAASGQVTGKLAGGSVQDANVFRSPTVLRNYTAAHCATVVADPLDPTSLYPGPNENRPLAKYRGSLQATDQHSVNVLMEKVTVQRQHDLDDGTSFELTCFCTQHKTGNVVEEVTKFLGLLSPSFCIASCLAQGDLGEEAEAKLPSTLDGMMDVVDPTELSERGGLSERDKRLVAFSQELMAQCYVNDVQRDQDCEDNASRTRSFQRTQQGIGRTPLLFPLPVEWSAHSPLPPRLLRRTCMCRSVSGPGERLSPGKTGCCPVDFDARSQQLHESGPCLAEDCFAHEFLWPLEACGRPKARSPGRERRQGRLCRCR